MNRMARNYALIIGLGVLTAVVWSFGFGKIYYVVYLALGSPERPTLLFWATLLLQSFLMGAIPGGIVPFVSHLPIRKATLVFVSAIFLFIFLLTMAIGGLGGVSNLVSSYGTWAFVLGAVAGCVGVSYAKPATEHVRHE